MNLSLSRKHILAAIILSLCGCTAEYLISPGLIVSTKDPNKKPNLARQPIGIHVQVFSSSSGVLAYADVTVKNNSGSPISELQVEVLWFQDSTQDAKADIVFESLEPGDKEFVQKRTRVDGYLWNDWTYTYTVLK